jgi:PAS domain S-box-containing protein
MARLRLDAKVAFLGASSAMAAAIILVAIATGLSHGYNGLAQKEIDLLIAADMDHVATGVYNLVQAEDNAVRELVYSHLEIARHSIEHSGGASLSPATARWLAVNQFSGDTQEVFLPRMLVGGSWLGQNRDPFVPSAIVDRVTGFAGATATIFQRMNRDGDMIRVATSVLDVGGRRAIGTYIPAREEGGAANPVVEAVLSGRTYLGRAYVVNAWYITAYEPIMDAKDNIIGMLYVGVPQRSAEARIRAAILGTKLGKTGYVWVVTGTGVDKGRYVISQGGSRDGEYIWDTRDAAGRYVTREIIAAATSLGQGELTTFRYLWQNPGEAEARWKVSRLAYYKPWDWVIGVGVYEDEMRAYSEILASGRARMTLMMAIAGAGVSLLLGFVGIRVAISIARPLRRITRAAEAMAAGDLMQSVEIRSGDELGSLEAAFNLMTGKIRESVDRITESEGKYRGIYENALEGMFRTTMDGRLIAANPALARILGYESQEEALALLSDIGRQTYVSRADRDAIVAELRDKGTVIGKEVLFRRKDGSTVWVSVSARRERIGDSGEFWLEGFITDISDRKEAEEDLKRLLGEKDALLKEVHHRVRNNLQLVVSMLDLQARYTEVSEVSEALHRFGSRVSSMALVHDGLILAADLSRIDFSAYAATLVSQLASAEPEGRMVDIEVDMPPLSMSLDMALPCGLALNEIVHNSLSHAFPPGWQGRRHLAVALREEDGHCRIIVEDNGVGLPAGYDPAAAQGLGMQLAFAAISQIGGHIEVLEGPGARFRLDLPRGACDGDGRRDPDSGPGPQAGPPS